MRIGVCSSFIGYEEKALLAESDGGKHGIFFLDDSKMPYDLSGGKPEVDAIVIRNQSFVRGICLARIFSAWGIPTFNSPFQIELCANKLFTTLHCLKSDIPVLPTKLAFTKKAGLTACEEVGYPVVIKPLYGGHGHLVSLAKDTEAAAGILESREILGNNFQKSFYIQKYIPLERDIRILVIGAEVVCGIVRQGNGEWRHNTSQGASASAFQITEEVRSLAKKIVNAFGEGIYGVDLFEGETGLIVNEVNHVAQFATPTRLNRVNIAGKIIAYIKETVQ